MARSVGVREAKTQLSRLLAAVASGEEVLITRRGEPVAWLTSEGLPRHRRSFGVDAGLWVVPPEFDDALPDGLAAAFGGGRSMTS